METSASKNRSKTFILLALGVIILLVGIGTFLPKYLASKIKTVRPSHQVESNRAMVPTSVPIPTLAPVEPVTIMKGRINGYTNPFISFSADNGKGFFVNIAEFNVSVYAVDHISDLGNTPTYGELLQKINAGNARKVSQGYLQSVSPAGKDALFAFAPQKKNQPVLLVLSIL